MAHFISRYLFSGRSCAMDSDAIFRLGSLVAFLGAAIVYFLTVDPTVSFWDCPEYALTAYRLEIGHAPGNPAWTLFHNVAARIADLTVGAGKVALVLNLCSGLFTALAVALLFQICFFTLRYAFHGRREASPLPAAFSALTASLIFAWSDSPWFSAVETEVYAMSLFFTALSMRLMIAWARAHDPLRRSRFLILSAYVVGLSIGVHELNLLVIPALALIYCFRRYPGPCRGRAWIALLFSVLILGSVLLGMYPSTATIAGEFELTAVNSWNLPYSSGVLIYLGLLLAVGLIAPWAIGVEPKGNAAAIISQWALLSSLVMLGGFLLFSRHFYLALFLSAAVGGWMTAASFSHRRGVATAAWMMTFCLLGFSVYLIIPIRSAANPPVNENDPSDVFSYFSYLKRDQYGKRPLFYGPTPYAKPLYQESFDSAGNPVYDRVVRKPYRPAYMKALPGAMLSRRSGLVAPEDSAANAAAIAAAAVGADRYVLADWRYDLQYTPELYMLFPRLTSRDATDISNYQSWAGMTPENMNEVEGSFALDTLGRPVGRLFSDGKRTKEKMLKPTYWQNIRELFGYQISYMYFRYLLWNYAGRQNDYPSAGEIEHGNFITGFAPADNLMLGDQDELPPEMSSENVGRNPYFMIPFILGVIGAVAAVGLGRRGRRADAVILTLFLMTGVAIVVFLNQDPGEPRERDYSFMGSFLAFAVWISMGIALLLGQAVRLGRKIGRRRPGIGLAAAPAATAILAAVPFWMLAVNYADHDRSYRCQATDFAFNTLESLDRDAILFVDGDNFTFPLWYAQEVLGIRRDVRVINLAYLSTPWHVAQQLVPGEEAKPLEMQARPENIAFERFSVIRLPSSHPGDSTLSIDALQEVRRLYASSDVTPRFSADWLRFPVAGKDSVKINLRSALGGSTVYSLRELAMIDIVASNAVSSRPRPVYWQNALITRQLTGMEPLTSRALYARKLTLDKNPADTAAYLCDEALRFLPRLRSGGTDIPGIYLDPYVGAQVSQQRMSLLRLADALLEQGRPADALRVARVIDSKFPGSAWPYQGMVARRGVVWQEGLKLADIYVMAGQAVGDRAAVARGRQLRKEQSVRLRRWKEWYKTLPEWRQKTVCRDSRRFINAKL